jgi:two-component system nitrogen regulation sensor histidine kinase GlnL
MGPVNIHQVMDHVLAVTEGAIGRGGIHVARQYDPSLPPVRGHHDSLIQVFLNLVQNALQAIASLPGDAPHELVLTSRVETGYHVAHAPGGRSRFLRFDVEDNGPGIPAEHQTSLFSPFFTTKPKGTGLGLAISHRIVAEHGGTIRFESAPGRTVFRVILPVWEGGAMPRGE